MTPERSRAASKPSTLTHTHNIQSNPAQIERLKVIQKFYQGSYFRWSKGSLAKYGPVTLSLPAPVTGTEQCL